MIREWWCRLFHRASHTERSWGEYFTCSICDSDAALADAKEKRP